MDFSTVRWEAKVIHVRFTRLSCKVVIRVRNMEKKPLKTTKIRDQIDAHVTHITAWTTLLGALKQKTP
jgi:hypothetical protein